MESSPDIAYVTGGASGIGLRVAEIFAERGADVAIFDLAPCAGAAQTIERARASTRQRVHTYGLDVTDPVATAEAFRDARARTGRPDVVFHAAGIGGFSRRFDEFPYERFERIIRVNLLGSRNVAAAALPLMESGGTLALVASLAGLVTAFGQSGYAASKHGVVGLAGVLRIECAPRGIGVCVICPPEIDTAMARADAVTRPAETAAMKLFAGSLALDPACRYMVDAMLRGRFLVIPGRRARIAWALQRWLPRVALNRIADRIVAKARHRARAGNP
ncbi:MAG: SDR family NAD(P)-dependent oxidoreductase [Deltaproteobacteria bacterium]|nr:SDR family NAD(P)-dependent oxidoreductase [Deltaproteobacteria bacterium]